MRPFRSFCLAFIVSFCLGGLTSSLWTGPAPVVAFPVCSHPACGPTNPECAGNLFCCRTDPDLCTLPFPVYKEVLAVNDDNGHCGDECRLYAFCSAECDPS